MTIGVVLITHRAKKHLKQCLPPLLSSPLKPRVLLVNSSSHDGTVELAQALGAETLVIPRRTFNHGTTRDLARRHLKTDIVVMMTPDAYALDSSLLEKLVAPLLQNKASIAYARQIPHDGADFFESFPRQFNYPESSELRRITDIPHHGVYTFFCSNTCAAYRNSALDEIGGFGPVLFGEDTVAVAKLLKRGHAIAYVSEAVVKHSHRYTLKQEFKRHFDIGLARRESRHLLLEAGKDAKRGTQFVKAMLSQLARKCPHLLPYGCLQIGMKWLGYRLGKTCHQAPLWIKKACSSQDFYWTSDVGRRKRS
ncbi:MAG: glycosyltransferase [Parachlamydia sp.]|nr:glycosyltransferase [Parachlamydia sp.]